jgi:hypothetical protein
LYQEVVKEIDTKASQLAVCGDQWDKYLNFNRRVNTINIIKIHVKLATISVCFDENIALFNSSEPMD